MGTAPGAAVAETLL